MNLVLLHGGWHSSASWGPLVPALLALGHRVVTPDLLGHGRRPDPANPFRRIALDSGHSPFASRPAELAAIIDGVEV